MAVPLKKCWLRLCSILTPCLEIPNTEGISLRAKERKLEVNRISKPRDPPDLIPLLVPMRGG